MRNQLAMRGPRVLRQWLTPKPIMTLACRRPAVHEPTDYQANPNANIYTQHGPYINKLTVNINILI